MLKDIRNPSKGVKKRWVVASYRKSKDGLKWVNQDLKEFFERKADAIKCQKQKQKKWRMVDSLKFELERWLVCSNCGEGKPDKPVGEIKHLSSCGD